MRKEETPIVVVYGFLGSGKTTVLLQLAKRITATGKRAAIVVNEAGKVPVDGKLLSVAGLPVKEIFGGCVCCSVVGDFVETLVALRGSGEFSCIFVEPSGMADAPRLFGALHSHGRFPLLKVLVVDGARFDVLMKAARPLMEGQIRAADIILLNKTDELSRDAGEQLHALIGQRTRSAHLYSVCALRGVPDNLLKEIISVRQILRL